MQRHLDLTFFRVEHEVFPHFLLKTKLGRELQRKVIRLYRCSSITNHFCRKEKVYCRPFVPFQLKIIAGDRQHTEKKKKGKSFVVVIYGLPVASEVHFSA